MAEIQCKGQYGGAAAAEAAEAASADTALPGSHSSVAPQVLVETVAGKHSVH